jgi:4-hydroxybutyryl-CoA dehydratase/vinylacetyl-CoA-Delta-isomerase
MALKTSQEFIDSIAALDLEIYLFGERVEDYTNHPIIRPSLNSMAMTY